MPNTQRLTYSLPAFLSVTFFLGPACDSQPLTVQYESADGDEIADGNGEGGNSAYGGAEPSGPLGPAGAGGLPSRAGGSSGTATGGQTQPPVPKPDGEVPVKQGRCADLGPGACPTVDPFCNKDDLTGIGQTGLLGVEYGVDFIAFCSGTVLIADIPNKQITARTIDDKIIGGYGFHVTPTAMELDEENGFLFVAHDDAPFISKIDLTRDEVSTIATGWPSTDIAWAGQGIVVAAIHMGTSATKGAIAVIDGIAGKVLTTVHDGTTYNVSEHVAFDRARGRLFSADAHLARWNLDFKTAGLIHDETVGTHCAGHNLALSPDGNQIAYHVIVGRRSNGGC